MTKYTYWLYKTNNYERFLENINNNTFYSCGYLSGNQISRIKKNTFQGYLSFKHCNSGFSVLISTLLMNSHCFYSTEITKVVQYVYIFIQTKLGLTKSVHKGKEQFTYPQITIITNWKFKFAVWACTCLSLVDNNPADGIYKALENVGHDQLKLHVDI